VNPGILTPPTQFATMPRGLLGRPTPVPMPDFRPAHPDAINWLDRVRRNGGSASQQTILAVSQFCEDIEAAGLRRRFLRVNLFCGDQLAAALTPLYLSGSTSPAAIGNQTDTNNGPFVQADYIERGALGGLQGNGATKFLNTGLLQSQITSLNDSHASISGTLLETSGDKMALGVYLVSGPDGPWIFTVDTYSAYVSGRTVRIGTYASAGVPSITNPGSSEQHLIGSRTSSTFLGLYRVGRESASNTAAVNPQALAQSLFVFAANSGTGSAANHTAARLRMYSVGLGLTQNQAMAFSSAVIAFNTALERV